MAQTFTELPAPKGLTLLNYFLGTNSYVDGFKPTQGDILVLKAIPAAVDAATYPHLARWQAHIVFLLNQQDSTTWAKSKVKVKMAKVAAEESEEEEESDEDSDSGLDLDDLEDSEDDEETKAMMAEKAEQIKAIHARQAAKAGNARSNLTLDVKPDDVSTDMEALESKIRAIEMDGLKWLGSNTIDIAFGLRKLRIQCQIVDVKIPSSDIIRDLIEEFEEVGSTDLFAFEMAR